MWVFNGGGSFPAGVFTGKTNAEFIGRFPRPIRNITITKTAGSPTGGFIGHIIETMAQ